ncbi:MAG: hypothetical protein KFH98_07310 [Gemmatimonadetes bacterium]|nr:hypothetical protein [Gemmatimonadota bacterium]
MTNHHAMTLRARLSGRLNRAVRYRGMLVLVIWQAPIQPVVRPDGSLGILIGSGADEYVQLACDGSLISSEPVKYRVAAVEADYDITPRVRADAMAGIMRSDRELHDGGFGTVRLRADWKKVGVGFGVAVSPAFEEYGGGTTTWPSAYVRGGSAEGLHARWEMFPPSVFAAQQSGRLGLGYNAVLRDRPSGFIGAAVLGGDLESVGIAADLSVPVADRFAIRLDGHYSPGHGNPIAGIAVGGKYLFGGGAGVSAQRRHEGMNR